MAANREVMIQSLPIEYRPADLSAFGLTPRAAASQVRDAIFGVTVAEVNEGVRRYGIAVRLHPDGRNDVETSAGWCCAGRAAPWYTWTRSPTWDPRWPPT